MQGKKKKTPQTDKPQVVSCTEALPLNTFLFFVKGVF